ncbi:hypothetical protein LDENG_00236560 [Lucifuga dentata]|nr:hypothetical protein LDENG_00236560 [Lucifuga dentata]
MVLVLHSPLHELLLFQSVQLSCLLETLSLCSPQFGFDEAVRTELCLHHLHSSQGQE